MWDGLVHEFVGYKRGDCYKYIIPTKSVEIATYLYEGLGLGYCQIHKHTLIEVNNKL